MKFMQLGCKHHTFNFCKITTHILTFTCILVLASCILQKVLCLLLLRNSVTYFWFNRYTALHINEDNKHISSRRYQLLTMCCLLLDLPIIGLYLQCNILAGWDLVVANLIEVSILSIRSAIIHAKHILQFIYYHFHWLQLPFSIWKIKISFF